MEYTIRHKNGTIVARSKNVTMNDNFMGENSITVSIKSPEVIPFALGDYLDYRGHRYYMAMLPSVQKNARPKSVGNAIVYDDIKMVTAAAYDMTRVEFRDVVLSSQAATYHTNYTNTTFDFYCESLIHFGERLLANLDRVCKNLEQWTVKVRLSNGNDYVCGSGAVADHSLAMGEKNVTVQISGQNCWDSLQNVKDVFKVNFIVVDRTITLGCNGTVVPHLFRYGKDNGVFKFERTTDDSQAVVTVLRAYGAEKNIPLRFYQEQSEEAGVGISNTISVKRLMLPGFGVSSLDAVAQDIYGEYQGKEDVIERIKDIVEKYYGARPNSYSELVQYVSFSTDNTDPYLVATKEYSLFGHKEGSVTFDGSGDYEEIYPSVKYLGESNKIIDAEQLTDDGTGTEENGNVPEQQRFWIKVALDFDPRDCIPFEEDSFTVHMNSGMCGGRDFKCVDVESVSDGIWKLTLERVEDSSLDLWFPYKDFNIQANNEFVLTNIYMPASYVNGTALHELLPQAIEALFENCNVKYKYSLTVDNIAMKRQHDTAVAAGDPGSSVYNTIKAGDEIKFSDADLDINYDKDKQTVLGSVLIDKLEIKEEDGKLPQYEITLVDEVSIGTIEQMQKQISALSSGKAGVSGGAGGYSTADVQNIVKALGDGRYLRKDSNDYTSHSLGIGGNLNVEGNATVQGVLHVTKLTADTLEIMEAKHISGKVISSPAGAVVKAVEEKETYWEVYFDLYDEDGQEVKNMFVVYDMVWCERFTVNDDRTYVASKTYWRLVTAVGKKDDEYNFIRIAKQNYCDFADVPEAGDTIVVLGSMTNADRRGAMISSPVGTFAYKENVYNAPYECQYVGIGSKGFVLPDPINVKSPSLTVVNANSIVLQSEAGENTDLQEFIDSYEEQTGDAFNITAVDWNAPTVTDDDGDTVGMQLIPANYGLPSSAWDEDECEEHLGDFIITANGWSYRFIGQDEAYYWSRIDDVLMTDLLKKYQSNARQIAGFSTSEGFGQLWAQAVDSEGNLLSSAYMKASTYFKDGVWNSELKFNATDILFEGKTFDLDTEEISISSEIFSVNKDEIKIDVDNFQVIKNSDGTYSLTMKGDAKFYGSLYTLFEDSNDAASYDKLNTVSVLGVAVVELPKAISNVGRRVFVLNNEFAPTRSSMFYTELTVEGGDYIYGDQISYNSSTYTATNPKKIQFMGGLVELLAIPHPIYPSEKCAWIVVSSKAIVYNKIQ